MEREQIIQWASRVGAERAGSSSFVIFNEELEAFAKLVAAHERNKLAAWMIQFGFATGHGDTLEELCDALGTEIVDRIDGEVEAEREACAMVCEKLPAPDIYDDSDKSMWDVTCMDCAEAIRARENNA
jgi:hypothetical protein